MALLVWEGWTTGLAASPLEQGVSASLEQRLYQALASVLLPQGQTAVVTL
jgi:hypothetical protein